NMFMWACVGELAPDEAYQKYLGAMTEKPATGIEPDLIERIHQVSGDAVYAQQRPMKELLDARQVPSGPFVNSQIVNEFYRNFYFSILHRMGMYVLEQLSSIDAAKLFAQQLQQALAQDEVGRDMASWFGSLCLLEVRVSGPIMAEDYFNFTRLGPTAAVRVYKKLTKYLSFGDAAFGVATEQLLQRLDDRIENRHYLSRFAINLLNDVFLYRRLVPNYKDEVVRNYPYDSAYDAYLNKDYQKIYDLLSVATGEKGNLIKLISKGEGIDVEKVIDLWKGAVKERPDAVGLAQGYAEFLMEQKQYAQAREVITAWLKISQPKDLQLVHSMNLIAKSYLLEGEYQKGYDAIAPHLEVGQNYSFLLAGQLLAKLNRFDEAKLIFLKAIDRYPGYFKTVMPYVKICWEHGKFEEAAQLLSQHAKLIRIEDWRWIVGKEFAEVFAELPLAKAQQAISFLVTNNISGYALRELAIALKNKEHYELALDVLDKVHVSGLGQVQADLDAYFILRKTKSDSEALTWLRGRLGG
ncbi:MAG TPA: hypothetical protein VJC18_05680, partial [bacterium]|nr:hypothetical protein [bacterium]